jgi:hypothetical protein
MYETTQSTDLTRDYSRTAGTSSESAEDSNPEGHPAGEDGIDFHYGEPVLQGFHTSDPAGRPAGEQVLTGYGARNPSNMSPIPSFDPSGRARAVRFHPTVSTSVAEGGRRSVLSTSHSSRMQSRGGPQVHLTRPPVVSIQPASAPMSSGVQSAFNVTHSNVQQQLYMSHNPMVA